MSVKSPFRSLIISETCKKKKTRLTLSRTICQFVVVGIRGFFFPPVRTRLVVAQYKVARAHNNAFVSPRVSESPSNAVQPDTRFNNCIVLPRGPAISRTINTLWTTPAVSGILVVVEKQLIIERLVLVRANVGTHPDKL